MKGRCSDDSTTAVDFYPARGWAVLLYGLDLGTGGHVEGDGAVSGRGGGNAAGEAQGDGRCERALGGGGFHGRCSGSSRVDLRLLRISGAHVSADVACAG